MAPKITPANLIGALQEAIALHNAGRLDEADTIYRKVLQIAPRHPDALHLRALVCHAKGDFAEAAKLADAAIAAAPRVANLHNTAGEAWRRLGDLGKARKRLAEAIRLDANMAMAYHNLSMVCSVEGRHQEAQQHNQRALTLHPSYPEALIHGLSIACAMDDGAAAEKLVAQVEKLNAQASARTALANYHCYRARRHFKQTEFAEGDEAAIAAVATDPEFWGGWALHGEAAFEQLDFGKAELYCTIAANLAPDNPDARRNLGLILKNQKRLDEAASHFAAWLEAHPDDAEARFNLATIELMQENYADGWKNYEGRWDMPALRQAKYAGAPLWRGQAVGSLLLYAEQGLGDTVQMLRFLPEVLRRCPGQIVLQVQAPMLRIVQRVFGSEQVSVVAEIPDAKFDAACPLMSLPLALEADSAERIRGSFPYLAASRQRVADFSNLLSRHPGRKLGLVWRGAEGSQANRLRTLPEAALSPLLELPGWTPVSLQFGVRDPQIGGRRLLDLSDGIADFEDLAAAMTAVDAVVSLDTGPAHLAGALGVTVYTLLPWLHDWRWGAEGERCSWYPDMELFRQPLGGSWQGPVARLAERLGGVPAIAEGNDGALRPRPIVGNRFPIVRAECRHGTVSLPLFDSRLTRSMLAYGEFCPKEAEILISYLKPGDSVVDAGAKVGALSLAMALAVGPDGRVFAIEPDPVLYRCLTESIADSGLAWVETRHAGETLQISCLDDMGIEACRLLRIDADGRELEALRGAAGLIGKHRPVICVECDSPGSQGELAAFLKRLDYRVFRHEAPLFSTSNFRDCPVDLFPGRVSGRLIVLPSGVLPLPEMQPVAV